MIRYILILLAIVTIAPAAAAQEAPLGQVDARGYECYSPAQVDRLLEDYRTLARLRAEVELLEEDRRLASEEIDELEDALRQTTNYIDQSDDRWSELAELSAELEAFAARQLDARAAERRAHRLRLASIILAGTATALTGVIIATQ